MKSIFVGNISPPVSGSGWRTRIRIQGPHWIRIRNCNSGIFFSKKKISTMFLCTTSVWYQIPVSDHRACINIMAITLSCSKKYYPLNTHLHHESGCRLPHDNKRCPCMVPFCPCHTGSKGQTGDGFLPQSTYICRVQSCVWRLPKYWPPTPLSTQRVCPLPAPKAGGHSPGGGGSIFWKTTDIGLASYSIISLRFLRSSYSNSCYSKQHIL